MSAPTHINNFPPEVIHAIFEHFYHDFHDLAEAFTIRSHFAACALTCKYWKPIATRFMWRVIKLDIAPDWCGKSLMRILDRHRNCFSNFAFTTTLEINFELCGFSTSRPKLERSIRYYWVLRQNLLKWISPARLDSLVIHYPEFRLSDYICDSRWATEEITRILKDVPVFVTELVEMCGVGTFRLDYNPNHSLGAEETDEYLPMLSEVSKLKHFVTDLCVSLSTELVESSSMHPMPRLKHLHLIEDDYSAEFYEKITGLGTWADLRGSPIESLSLAWLPIDDPMFLPETMTTLSIINSGNVIWALDLGFFHLPNLREFYVEMDRDPGYTEEIIPMYEIPEHFRHDPIVSTKLQSLYIRDCHFEAEILGRVAFTCHYLSSISIQIPIHGNGFILSFLEDHTDYFPGSAIVSDSFGYVPSNYWSAFMRGFPADILHVIYCADGICDCCGGRKRKCYCDVHLWTLRKSCKDASGKYPKMVVLQRDGPGNLGIRMLAFRKDTDLPRWNVELDEDDPENVNFFEINERVESGENVMYWEFHRSNRFSELQGRGEELRGLSLLSDEDSGSSEESEQESDDQIIFSK